jgi:hypothetical protein
MGIHCNVCSECCLFCFTGEGDMKVDLRVVRSLQDESIQHLVEERAKLDLLELQVKISQRAIWALEERLDRLTKLRVV